MAYGLSSKTELAPCTRFNTMRYVLDLLHGRTWRLANGIRLLSRGRGLNRGLRRLHSGGRDRVHFCKRARSVVYFVLLLLKLVNFLEIPKTRSLPLA